VNHFTVDVEEWFHVCGVEDRLPTARWDTLPSRVVDTTRRLLDDLDATGVSATFFVVGWVAERHPSLVGEIAAAGHRIGAHGHWHRRVYEQTPEAFAADLAQNVAAIRAAGIAHVGAFRAPEWSANDRAPWAAGVLTQAGFTVDASRAPVAVIGSRRYPRRPYPMATPSGPLYEYPPFVVTRGRWAWPLGWGWALRSASPRSVIEAIEARNIAGDPAVLMVHPWEIDPDPPRVRLPTRLAFAHYFRLGGFRERLRTILAGASFRPLPEHASGRR
jgi:peptidoglycan-N-acetylglucosamine deacetylase